MGQQAAALVLGVQLTAKDKQIKELFFNEEGDGILDGITNPRGVGHVETGVDFDLVGISLGISNGPPEPGERELPKVTAVFEIPSVFRKQIAAANKRWAKLAAAVTKKSGGEVRLPEPRILLALVERA